MTFSKNLILQIYYQNMTRACIAFLFVIGLYNHSYGQDTIQKSSTLDSLHILLEQANNNDKIDHLLTLSDYYGLLRTENLDSMRYYANQALELSSISDIKTEQSIEALYNLALADYYSQNYDDALFYLQKVISDAEIINYGEGLRKGNIAKAEVHIDQENYLEGLYYYNRAYEIAKQNKIPINVIFDTGVDLSTEYLILEFSDETSKILADITKLLNEPTVSLESKGIYYLNMATIHEMNDNYDTAIDFFRKSIEIHRKDNNKRFQIAPFMNIGNIQTKTEKYEEAINTFTEALNFKNLDQIELGNINYNLGYCYMKLEQPEKADQYLKASLQNHKNTKNIFREAASLETLAILKQQEGKTNAANTYFRRAAQQFSNSIEENKKYKIKKEEISNSYLELHYIDSIRGNYKSGLEHYKNHIIYKDSIKEEREMKIAERLEFAKEAAEKDQEISQLANENRIQRFKAKQQQTLKIVLFIILALALLLLFVIFNRFRLKKKALKIIQEKNEENKLLMREIHHRVKNNLQIILSLLGAQIDSHKSNTELEEALMESQNKIKSMAIIHQNLYQGNQYTKVDVGSYTKELTNNIKKSFGNRNSGIQLQLNIDPKQIKMGLAVPLGLIINELITNCYKYAFTDTEAIDNKVSISFKQIEDTHQFRLIIKDNGQGLPENFDIDKLPSFGMQLVQGLVQQLQGEIQIIQDKGTTFDILLEEPIAA